MVLCKILFLNVYNVNVIMFSLPNLYTRLYMNCSLIEQNTCQFQKTYYFQTVCNRLTKLKLKTITV